VNTVIVALLAIASVVLSLSFAAFAYRQLGRVSDDYDSALDDIISDGYSFDRLDDTAVAGRVLQNCCHLAAVEAGWWTNLKTGEPLNPELLVPEKLCLIHSEISEAMEGHRKGLMDDKLPHRKAIEVELADAVIRIGDLAGALGLDLGAAISEKMHFNAHRADHKVEARKAAGGKAY
jgi:NTP pyrophosphatase (non-canonical NTP hydrolase)